MEYKNILIIKMSSLGDVLHTLPFVAVLRDRFPKARISWLVHPQFGAFVPDPPLVDEVIYFDKAAFSKMGWRDKLATYRDMKKTLRSKKFDLVIDLQGLFKSAVLAYLTGDCEKIGYCEMREGSSLVSRPIRGEHARDHVIERYLDVARYLGCKADEIRFPMPDLTREWESVRKKLAEKDAAFASDVPYAVLVPGARWETKRWPAENFAKLAGLFAKDGIRTVLAGGREDVPLGEAIKKLEPSTVDLTGNTTLRELGALIERCRIYVSADTGPLFIASAFKKPLVAVYGPTRPERTGPYGNPDATVMVADVPCAGCLKKHCGDWKCMKSITPETVYAASVTKTGGR